SAAPALHQIVSQVEHVVQQYHEQGAPQAPLLALVHQVLLSLLPTDGFSHEGAATESRSRAPLIERFLPDTSPKQPADCSCWQDPIFDQKRATCLPRQEQAIGESKSRPSVETFGPPSDNKWYDAASEKDVSHPTPIEEAPMSAQATAVTTWDEQPGSSDWP